MHPHHGSFMRLRFTTGLPRPGVMGLRPEALGAMTARADLTETTIDAMAVTMMATEVTPAVATGTIGVAEQSLHGERTGGSLHWLMLINFWYSA